MNNNFQTIIPLRISVFLSNLIQTETLQQGFVKINGEPNINEFLNKMLPNMIEYRKYKNSSLRDYLERNVADSISKSMQQKILDFMTNSFDYIYFNESDNYFPELLNIRISKKNKEIFTSLFCELDILGIKKSSYIRNLINEFCNLPKYQKEWICFHNENTTLNNHCDSMNVIQITYEKQDYVIIPMSISYSFNKEKWYLIAVDYNEHKRLYSMQSNKINNIIELPLDFNLEDKYGIEINNIIEQEMFDQDFIFVLGESLNE